METTLNTVAETANDDTLAILERIDRNTKSMNQDIEFLSKQSGKHEMFFNRIKKKRHLFKKQMAFLLFYQIII